jgi:uncharacterized protein YprB with RNaseH-like and TPR domain
MSLYLDIETSFHGRITVIGFYSRSTGLVQMVAPEISKGLLMRALPGARKLYTFNGHCFDLPVIQRELGLRLRSAYDSRDLRFIGNRLGLFGGLKALEKKLGIPRRLPDLDGMDAMRLWEQHRWGDEEALTTLLAYNREDVMNMILLRRELRAMGAPC